MALPGDLGLRHPGPPGDAGKPVGHIEAAPDADPAGLAVAVHKDPPRSEPGPGDARVGEPRPASQTSAGPGTPKDT